MTTNRLMGVLLAVAVALAAAGAGNPSGAVLRLLNSRSSGSARAYAEAAEEVAVEAREGKAVYAFVLALISREKDPPPAARLDEKTRQKYLDDNRGMLKRIAVERNNPMALYLLALDSGDTNLLHRAADVGNVQAQNAWGLLLFNLALGGPTTASNQVDRLLRDAHGYFKQAAGQGDANGLYNLGMCLWRGLGVARDDQAAFQCLRTAAEKGHSEAINNIGGFFRDGVIVDRDLELSTKWFEKSASYENPYGQFNFAMALRRGDGVKQDDKKAVELLEKSAAGGCIEAVNVLGVMLWKGQGVKKDAKRAFDLFSRAAANGYPPAMENLSSCYEQGDGVEKDERQSLAWKMRSRAARGDRASQQWLEQNGF